MKRDMEEGKHLLSDRDLQHTSRLPRRDLTNSEAMDQPSLQKLESIIKEDSKSKRVLL
jgi:hypothetical protein